MNPIEVAHATKRYGAVTGYTGVSFTVAPGEMFGLIGPDGAGKTSLIRTLCTLLQPDEGDIRVLGYGTVQGRGDIRARIGYMPQRFSLYPDLTVPQNLAFYARLFNVPRTEQKQRLAELYRFSRLEPFKQRRAGALSGGMKQKLALSCTLVHTPALLLLDEPTFGVDPVSREEFWELLTGLRAQGATILASTPYMDEAERFDRVALMYGGRVLRLGTPAELRATFPWPLLRVTGNALRALRGYFARQPEVKTLQLFGDALHVGLAAQPSDATVARWRSEAGFADWQPIAPSLEDVLLHEMGGNRE